MSNPFYTESHRTYSDTLTGKTERDKRGPQIRLRSKEDEVVDWINFIKNSGFIVTKALLLETNKIHCFESFLNRHKNISEHITSTDHIEREEKVTENDIETWFDRVNSYFDGSNLLHIFEDPKRIFTCDEVGLFLRSKHHELLRRHSKLLKYSRVPDDENECLNVLVNVSADGNMAPPLILYPCKNEEDELVPIDIAKSVPGWWGIGGAELGWMTMATLYEYVANVFHPWLLKNDIQLPVVLFMDARTSLLSLPLTTICKEKGIVLVALLPNSTMQPLNLALFKPIKKVWRDTVDEFTGRHFADLRRVDFAPEVQRCFKRCLTPETIQRGFQDCGIYPLDRRNVAKIT